MSLLWRGVGTGLAAPHGNEAVCICAANVRGETQVHSNSIRAYRSAVPRQEDRDQLREICSGPSNYAKAWP